MNKRSKNNGSAKEAISSILQDTLEPKQSPAKKNGTKPKNGKVELPVLIEEHDDETLNTRELLRVLGEVRNGNFSLRMPIDKIGISGKICDTLNEIISLNEILMLELTKAGKNIGKQGNLAHRVELPKYASGSWRAGVDSINGLISDLVHPTIEIAHVISSVAKGNLSQEMPLQIGDHVLQGEFSRIAKEVNDMVKQLNLFSMEVTRVAREVGSEGKLGGQARVKGVAGVWKDLTDSVNQMAGNLTAQVRNIAEVTTAVAKGDL
jgi:HAMP domain-containing protein